MWTKEQHRIYNKQWYQENKERLIEKQAKQYENPEVRERKKLWSKKYYKENKEKRMRQQRERREEMARWFRNFKSKLVCFYCDEDFYACLDFHHKDIAEKSDTISRMVRGYPKARILKEISKCDVVCRNCHAKIHHNGEGIWNK